MRRVVSLLAVVAVTAALVAAMAMPAFASEDVFDPPANENASCKGQSLSEHGTEFEPGEVGAALSGATRDLGGIGQDYTSGTGFGEARSCNPNANPNGGGFPRP